MIAFPSVGFPGLDGWETRKTPFAECYSLNGIQEVDGSIPFSSTKSLAFSFPRSGGKPHRTTPVSHTTKQTYGIAASPREGDAMFSRNWARAMTGACSYLIVRGHMLGWPTVLIALCVAALAMSAFLAGMKEP